MLVLSRKLNQTIRIGNDITIMVVDIRGDKVRLGIQAPAGITILRSELLTAIAEPIDQPGLVAEPVFFDPLGDLMPVSKTPNYVRTAKG